jgi:hypothetical protein
VEKLQDAITRFLLFGGGAGEPVNWSTMSVDPRDIENGMKVDQNFLSPLELKKKRKVSTASRSL